MITMLRAAALAGLLAAAAQADDFDLYTASVLRKIPAADGASALEQITLSELSRAEPVLPGRNGPLLVVRTDEGHWAKMVVGRAIRKQNDAEQPIVVIQRYQTMRPDSENGRLAAGKNIYLFDGFRFNLDIGQVVPEGSGGDVEFHRDGESDGYLQPIGKAKLYLVTQPLVQTAEQDAQRARGPVTAQDFAGKYHLVANGQWSGTLTLKVAKNGEVTGTYLSDQTGRDYPVKGAVTTPTHHIRFTVELPMSKQDFDGYLWTRGKNALAGVTTLAERPFGFVALRDGAELMPKEDE
jgi:hypothetical protein